MGARQVVVGCWGRGGGALVGSSGLLVLGGLVDMGVCCSCAGKLIAAGGKAESWEQVVWIEAGKFVLLARDLRGTFQGETTLNQGPEDGTRGLEPCQIVLAVL